MRAKSLFFSFLFVIVAHGSAVPQSLTKCLSRLEAEFGKQEVAEVPLSHPNKDYALSVKFGNHCDIVQIDVAPKFTWRHEVPKWEEPDYLVSLTEDHYQEILLKISRLKLVGQLVERSDDKITVVTNSKTEHWDHYENAIVKRTMHCCPNNKPPLTFLFTAYFFHTITGRAGDSRIFGSASGTKLVRVRINHHSYLISSKEATKVRRGKPALIRVAGPID